MELYFPKRKGNNKKVNFGFHEIISTTPCFFYCSSFAFSKTLNIPSFRFASGNLVILPQQIDSLMFNFVILFIAKTLSFDLTGHAFQRLDNRAQQNASEKCSNNAKVHLCQVCFLLFRDLPIAINIHPRNVSKMAIPSEPPIVWWNQGRQRGTFQSTCGTLTYKFAVCFSSFWLSSGSPRESLPG